MSSQTSSPTNPPEPSTLRCSIATLDRVRLGLLERIDPIDAIATIDAIIADLSGEPVTKAKGWDLTSDEGFAEAVLSIALRMRGEEKKQIQNWLRPFRTALERNWPELSARERTAAISEVKSLIEDLGGRLARQQGIVLDQFSERIVQDAKASAIDRYGLGVSPTFTRVDRDAMDKVLRTQVNFIRDREGRISERFSKDARYIVAGGVEAGLGRREIAAELFDAFGDMRTQSYWDFIANHFVAQGRTVSTLNAYASAGVTIYRIVAVVDERTTDTCRFLDGQIFDVQESITMLDRAYDAASEDWNAIKETNPFVMRYKDEATGGYALRARQPEGRSVTVAQIVRSGVGTAGDKGQFAKGLNPGQMLERGIGPPPYHAFCRTIIAPEFQETVVPVTPPPAEPGAVPAAPTPPRAPPPPKPPKAPVGPVTYDRAKSVKEFAALGVVNPQFMSNAAKVEGSPRVVARRAREMFEGFRERGEKRIGDLLSEWKQIERIPDVTARVRAQRGVQERLLNRFQEIGKNAAPSAKEHEKAREKFVTAIGKKFTRKMREGEKDILRRAYDAYGPLADRAATKVRKVEYNTRRGFWRAAEGLISYRRETTIAHEFSHVVEYVAGTQRVTKFTRRGSFWSQFRDSRKGRGEKPLRLSETGGGYDAWETYIKDKFKGLDAYTSKVYPYGATEFVSMLGEMLLAKPDDPSWSARSEITEALKGSPDVVAAFFGWVEAAVQGAKG